MRTLPYKLEISPKDTKTHYDTLGVRPGDPEDVIAKRYFDLVSDLLDPHFPFRTSMRREQAAQDIVAYTEAFRVVQHSDWRAQYDKELNRQVRICTMCEGKGWFKAGQPSMLGQYPHKLDCIACHATGKAA